MFNDKILKSVAEAVKQVLTTEKLHPNQQKLDVHEPEKDKLTAKDFEMLRKGKKAEVKEANNPFDVKNYKSQLPTKPGEKAGFDSKKVSTGTIYSRKPVKDEKPLKEEDAYGKDRYAVKDGKAVKDNPKHMGSDNYKDQPHHVWATSAEEAMKKKSVKESVTQTEYNTEIEKAKKKAGGKGNPDLTKGAVTAVKQESVELSEEINVKKDYDDHEQSEHGVYKGKRKIGYIVHNKKEGTHTAYHGHKYGKDDYENSDDFSSHEAAVKRIKSSAGIQESVEQIEERQMTEPEMKKREKIVKSMKKGMQGFKDRYGDRAKNVMYATATKQAMKD